MEKRAISRQEREQEFITLLDCYKNDPSQDKLDDVHNCVHYWFNDEGLFEKTPDDNKYVFPEDIKHLPPFSLGQGYISLIADDDHKAEYYEGKVRSLLNYISVRNSVLKTKEQKIKEAANIDWEERACAYSFGYSLFANHNHPILIESHVDTVMGPVWRCVCGNKWLNRETERFESWDFRGPMPKEFLQNTSWKSKEEAYVYLTEWETKKKIENHGTK